jgi:hypothetical protein
VPKPRVAISNYTAEQLAPLLVPALQDMDGKLEPLAAAKKLQPYVRLALLRGVAGKTQVSRLPTNAIEAAEAGGTRRTSSKSLPRLNALAKLMRRQGHRVRLMGIPGETLKKKLMDAAKRDHDRRAKEGKKNVEPWNAARVEGLLDIKDEAEYFLGWCWAPATSLKQFKSLRKLALTKLPPPTSWLCVRHRSPLPSSADPVGQADFAFMKGPTKGQLAVLTFSDSDHHCVPLVYMHLLDSENFSSWNHLLSYAKHCYPDLDSDLLRIISDQDKGGESALNATIVRGRSFFCAVHRKKNVRGGATAKALFMEMVRANTVAELHRLKQKLPATTQRYLAGVPDAKVAAGQVAAGHMHGYDTSNSAESLNNTNTKARQQDFYMSLLELNKLTGSRFNTNKAKVYARTASEPQYWPPAVDAQMERATDLSPRYTNVTFLDQTKETALVQSLSVPGLNYNSTLCLPADDDDVAQMACDCGRPDVTGLPCGHNHAHAMKAGLQIHTFMHKADTRDGWEEQYPADLRYPTPPSAAQVEVALQEEDDDQVDNWLLPPRIPRGKGRPNKKRNRHPAEASKQKKRQVTCQICFKTGHTKRSCPQNIGGSVEVRVAGKRPRPA